MNSLSWLLYLSDAIPNVARVLTPVALLLAFGAAGSVFFGFVVGCGPYADRDDRLKGGSVLGIGMKRLLPLAVALGIVIAVIPDKQTILMIAASEMGETVIKTPEAQEVFSDLKVILKKQLETLKK